jgi:uncharacterized membrane-anchored protein YjiN (DUF445 family)
MTATTDPTAPITAAPRPPSVDPARRREIRRAKRRATGLLIVVAALYLVVAFTTEDEGTAGYVRAGLEAAMVGGLADWFAVVAIFRHPMGIPIPHTAVIVGRKDAFGETLGQFVQEHFLNPEAVGRRVRSAAVAERGSAWLLEEENAARVAGHASGLVVRLAEVVRDDDLVHMAEAELRSRLADVDVAPLAGRLLEIVTEEGRHRELVDGVLRGIDGFLGENEELLRRRFGQESPWWLPDVIDERIFERLLEGVRAIIRGDTVGGSVELRDRIDGAVGRIVERLEHDDVWRARAEELKVELLDHPALRAFLDSLWADTKESIRAQATDGGSMLRTRLTDAITSATERFREDAALMARVDELAESTIRAVIETFGDEISDLIASTIEQWDGDETADRLELLLGRDLQFIRINGTVVGGLAGLAIHAVGQLAG